MAGLEAAKRHGRFQKLVDVDRNFAVLLSNRDPSIRLPSTGTGDDVDKGMRGFTEGKYSLVFVRLDGRFIRDGLSVPINRPWQVLAWTDAENGYLNCSDNPESPFVMDLDKIIRDQVLLSILSYGDWSTR